MVKTSNYRQVTSVLFFVGREKPSIKINQERCSYCKCLTESEREREREFPLHLLPDCKTKIDFSIFVLLFHLFAFEQPMS